MSISFNELKKNIKKDFSGMPIIKVAVLADSASQLFCDALKGYGYFEKINLQIWEADYNRIYESVMEEDGELYEFQPAFIIIFQSSRKLLSNFYKSETEEKNRFADDHIKFVDHLTEIINTKIKSTIIYLNFPEINDSVFGNFSNKTPYSFIYQLRNINVNLMKLAVQKNNFNVADLSSIQNQHGISSITSDRLYVNSDIVLNIDIMGDIAKIITDIILAFTGRFKKCLILDLDNTLWGGVIGDDGIENIQIGNLKYFYSRIN